VFTTNADGPGVSDVPLGTPADIDGVKVTYFAVGTPRRLFRAPAMKAALAGQVAAFDLVHLHSVFLWPTLVAARAARQAGVPYVLSPRGMLVGELIRAKSGAVKRAWLRLFERRTIREAAALHFTSGQEAADFAALGLNARRAIELPNGVDAPPAPGEPAPDVAAAIAGGRYLLYLGRLNWKKNLPALIEAVAGTPGLRLVIAGNDEEGHVEALTRAAAAHGIGDRLALVARGVEGADKEALFAGAAIFALPSLNENFGNTVLEAMARGVPVIASSGAGVAQVVREAGSGLVADPTPHALAEVIAKLEAEPAAAHAMGAAGRRAATERYGWGAVAERMVEAYRELG
jgi:glycosyltransferase involved in cell wall biosynthesis